VCPRTPSLTLVLGLGWLPAGHMMCDGVFRQMCCGRSVFLGRVPVGDRQEGLGSWPRFIGLLWACRATVRRSRSDGLHGLVTELAQEVVAAFQEFAGDSDARAV
jgi:hypothetical protein